MYTKHAKRKDGTPIIRRYKMEGQKSLSQESLEAITFDKEDGTTMSVKGYFEKQCVA